MILLRPDAKRLSANTVSRLKRDWAKEYDGWREVPLNKEQWVYIWANGVSSDLYSEDDKLCTLAIIGVNARGQKHFLAIEDGVRESTQSWREVLLNLKDRGMNAPTALLDAQNDERAELSAQAFSAKVQSCFARYLAG